MESFKYAIQFANSNKTQRAHASNTNMIHDDCFVSFQLSQYFCCFSCLNWFERARMCMNVLAKYRINADIQSIGAVMNGIKMARS